MIKDLSLSRTAGGTIFNAYLFSYIILTPITGYLTDRFGARYVITICTFILGAGVFLMGTVESLWTACLFYTIVGLGSTGMWTPIITVVQRWFAPNRRGLALGILSTGYGLGFATMGVVFPWIVNQFSWRYSWYFLGTGALLMIVANGLLLRSDPASAGYLPWGQKKGSLLTEAGKGSNPKREPLSNVFKNSTFWLIGLSYFSISYSLYGITTFMVDYAHNQIGLPFEKASFLATIHGVCQVVGVLTVLPLSDYIGRKRTIIFSNSFITIANNAIRCGTCENALVIGAERLSSVVNWRDRNTCVLLADGAGAVVVTSKKDPGILQGIDLKPLHLIMDGNRLFKKAIEYMSTITQHVMQDTSLCSEEIQLVIPHQANIRIIQGLAKSLKVPMERVYTNIHKYGNTSSATIPIALDEANREGLVKKGDNVLLVSFGSGITWGASILNWSF